VISFTGNRPKTGSAIGGHVEAKAAHKRLSLELAARMAMIGQDDAGISISPLRTGVLWGASDGRGSVHGDEPADSHDRSTTRSCDGHRSRRESCASVPGSTPKSEVGRDSRGEVGKKVGALTSLIRQRQEGAATGSRSAAKFPPRRTSGWKSGWVLRADGCSWCEGRGNGASRGREGDLWPGAGGPQGQADLAGNRFRITTGVESTGGQVAYKRGTSTGASRR